MKGINVGSSLIREETLKMKCAQEEMFRKKKVWVNSVVMVRTGTFSIKRVLKERVSF